MLATNATAHKAGLQLLPHKPAPKVDHITAKVGPCRHDQRAVCDEHPAGELAAAGADGLYLSTHGRGGLVSGVGGLGDD